MNGSPVTPIARFMKAFATIAIPGLLAAQGPIATEVRGDFVLLRHGDTLRIERFTVSDRVVQSEVLKPTENVMSSPHGSAPAAAWTRFSFAESTATTGGRNEACSATAPSR